MLLHNATDGVLCWAFPLTLRKSAWYWFSGLKLSSIHSFYQLSWSFISHFASSKNLHQSSDSLIHVKQKEGESLRSYVSQINEVALEVYNLDHSVSMTTLKSGFQQYPFLFSLEKRLAANFSEILLRVEKYACAEEGLVIMLHQLFLLLWCHMIFTLLWLFHLHQCLSFTLCHNVYSTDFITYSNTQRASCNSRILVEGGRPWKETKKLIASIVPNVSLSDSML